MAQKLKNQKKRKLWYRGMKKLMLGRYKEPRFIYLGEKIGKGGMILSNHEGTDAPMSLEIYLDAPITMWGAHEMNSGLVKMYKYQTRVYYHEKKHWNLHLARLFCLLASPLTNLFYKGLDLISTYKDARFKTTLKESIEALKKGDNIVIFPEDSSDGYLDELKGFFAGFTMLGEVALKEGMDLPVYVTYFKKNERVYIIDSPVKYSTLKEKYGKREDVAKTLVERCNELGKMDTNALLQNTEDSKEKQNKEEI